MLRIECRGRSSQVSLETFSRKTTNNLETKDETERYGENRPEGGKHKKKGCPG
jgi:hypothetical protein